MHEGAVKQLTCSSGTRNAAQICPLLGRAPFQRNFYKSRPYHPRSVIFDKFALIGDLECDCLIGLGGKEEILPLSVRRFNLDEV